MRVSIISPSFNQAAFLPDNLRTVSHQVGVDLEHIIVDPGSTDGSRELAQAATHATVIAEPDRGQSHGITKGFERCTGDVMAWLNSDDFYPSPDTLKKVVDVFERHPDVDIVYGGVDFVDEQGAFIRKGYVNRDTASLAKSLEYQVGIVQPGVFWRRRVFEALGGPSEEFEYCMDYEYWVRMALAGFKWQFLDETLAHHRWWPGMKTSSGRQNSLIEHFKVGARHFGYIHHKWIDRLAEFVTTQKDGVVSHADEVNPAEKSANADSIIRQYVTQDMLSLLAQSDRHQHRETLEYIRAHAPTHEQIMLDDNTLTDPVYAHADPDAESRMAWHIFDCTSPSREEVFKSYRVPGNFTRHFEAEWYRREAKHAQSRLNALRESRKSTCVIVANGPSLNKSDFSLLQHADVMVSNFAVISPELKKHATYFTVVNDLVASQGSVEFNQLEVEKIVPFWLGNAINSGPRTIFLPATVRPGFNADLDGVFSWRSTVSFFNMQVAFALGYENVVLIGFDHSYVQAEELKEGDEIEQKTEDPNHFDPRYFKGKTWQAADTGNMEKMYELAFEAYRKAGRNIVNATVGGKLEVFPRMSLERALGVSEPKPQVELSSKPYEIYESEFPRLLIFDMTECGNGSATGQLKSTLFDRWPRDKIAQVSYSKGSLRWGARTTDCDTWSQSGGDPEDIRSAIDRFKPEAILYRPVPKTQHLHDLAMATISALDVPVISWLMDDWPADIAHVAPKEWRELEPDLLSIIDRSAICLSICDKMSGAFEARYGKPFVAFANAVDLAEWPQHAHPGAEMPFTLRFAGGLAENMNRESVLAVAEAVESLVKKGHEVRFEINTHEWWYQQTHELFEPFTATSISTVHRSNRAYVDWLSEADALLLTYNFDAQSARYVRYSMANKLPEYLASGSPILAFGPQDIATIDYLAQNRVAQTVTTNDPTALENGIVGLMQDESVRDRLSASGRALVAERHELKATRNRFYREIVSAVKGRHYSSLKLLRQIVDRGEGAQPALLLTVAGTTILLGKPGAASRLFTDAKLESAIESAKQALPASHPARQHFERIIDYSLRR